MRKVACRLLLPLALLALVGVSAPPVWGQSTSSCPGDCNGDGRVTVADIVVLVNVALGQLPESACATGLPSCTGGILSVNCDIVGIIMDALDGCPPAQAQASHVHS